jgi:hypothetical protein
LLASPALLLPDVWHYVDAYMGEKLLTHSGYLFAGRLYKNNMSSSPFWGTPIYFYLLFLLIKVPPAVLFGLIVGLGVSIKRRHEVGYAFLLFMFFFWLIPYSLIGGKWLRYTLAVMPFVYMLAAVGVVAIVSVVSKYLKMKPALVATFAIIIFAVLPSWTAIANGPHYALYTNMFAPGKAGFYFPHDEFYDASMRDVIWEIARQAKPGVTVGSESPSLAGYYAERVNRKDLKCVSLSDPEALSQLREGDFIVVDRGRRYFSNDALLAALSQSVTPTFTHRLSGVTSAEVYVVDARVLEILKAR